MKSYCVGTSCFSFTDETRDEVLGNASGKRKIAVRMYYPVDADAVNGHKKAKIFSERKAEALGKAYHVNKFLQKVKNEADYYENIPISDKEKFPLILYNHGYNAYIESNTFLCCELASHGYIVASIGHANEAIATEYVDGSIDYYDKSLNKRIITPYFKALRVQMKLLKKKLSEKDAWKEFDEFQHTYSSFMIGRIEEWAKDSKAALKEIKERYAEAIDMSCGIGATGHSFGGATAYYLCQYEKDITCGINIDGALYGEYAGMNMQKPFMQICCAENYNAETKPLLDTEAPIYVAKFQDMKHIGFTDAKFFVPIKSLVGTMEPQVMQSNLNQLHVEFFDRYLRQNKDAEIKTDSEQIELSVENHGWDFPQ